MKHPDGLRLDDQLCFALYAATNAVTRAYRPLLEELGLTYPQYLVMLVLWQDGPKPVNGIARRLGLAQNAITPLVDRLEQAGLAERVRGERDRRVVQVRPTREGRDLEVSTAWAQHTVECRTELEPRDLERLRDELMDLVERMEGEAAPAKS